MADKIITHPATDEYRAGYDRIFGGFKPRSEGGVIRSGNADGALFHGDALSLRDGVVIQHQEGCVYEWPECATSDGRIEMSMPKDCKVGD